MRSQMWATRIMHEASLHDYSCFLTLTYRDIPDYGSLCYSHFQAFMKRLRARLGPTRFFMCGEYGDQFGRPHYHVCLFGTKFPDMVPYSEGKGARLFTSALLDDLWRQGECKIGDLTFESAAYVARYCLKKVTGDKASGHYSRLSEVTGEIYEVVPEFSRMSLNPGIGAGWFDKWYSDVYPKDYVIEDGRKVRPPRYYDKRFSVLDGTSFQTVSESRFSRAMANADDCTPDRLRTREIVTKASLRSKLRNLG